LNLEEVVEVAGRNLFVQELEEEVVEAVGLNLFV
jgi:hypothetical protein